MVKNNFIPALFSIKEYLSNKSKWCSENVCPKQRVKSNFSLRQDIKTVKIIIKKKLWPKIVKKR